MENIYFSPRHGGFLQETLREMYSFEWPDDAVKLTDEEITEFYTTLSPIGKILGSKDGRPWWVDAPVATQHEKVVQNEAMRADLKRTADSEIAWRQDAVDAEMATEDEVTALTAWKKYRVLLMRVDVNSPKWPKVPA